VRYPARRSPDGWGAFGGHLRAAREIFADLGALPLVEQTDDLLRIATAKTS